MAATVVLDQQQRNGAFGTGSVPVPLTEAGTPATNPDTGQPYQFLAMGSTMSDADALDTAKRMFIYLRATYDGTNYVTVDSTEWAGGTNRFGNPNVPSFTVSMQPDDQGRWPKRVMVNIDTEGFTLNLGVTLEVK